MEIHLQEPLAHLSDRGRRTHQPGESQEVPFLLSGEALRPAWKKPESPNVILSSEDWRPASENEKKKETLSPEFTTGPRSQNFWGGCFFLFF